MSPPEEQSSVSRYRAAVAKQREREVAYIKDRIASLQRQQREKRPTRDRARQINELQARLRALENGEGDPTPVIDPFNLSVGDIGMPGVWRSGSVREVATYTVTQVFDDRVLLMIEGERREPRFVILSGIGTDGLVDGKRLKMNEIYEVTGITSYESVLGAKKTVFVLKPYLGKR